MYKNRKLTADEKRERIQQRRDRGYPLHQPPHPIRDQPYYFLTAACYQHQHHLRDRSRRQQVIDTLFALGDDHAVELRAWVILTNHYHLLVHVVDFERLSTLFGRLHGQTSRQWNLEDTILGRKVWYRFADRAIRSERHYYTALNYIHYNPVKHGLVHSPYDWVESSVHWYLKNRGREWLRDVWRCCPVRAFGEGWDKG